MIISTNIGGLCNRIRCISSCIRYAHKNNIEYKVYWKILDSYKKHTHILNCAFNKLFSNIIETKVSGNFCYKHHCLIFFEDDNLPINFNNFKSKCSSQI